MMQVHEIWSMTDKFLSFWTFCPLNPLTTPGKSKVWINEKNAWRYIYAHFTHVYHKWKIYDVSVTGRSLFWTIFCPFTSSTSCKINIFKKRRRHLEISSFYTWVTQMAIIWCMLPEIWSAQWTEHFVILDQFLPFYPCKHLENKNFENMKKIPGDIIVLHMRTINDNDMMYVCSDMERKRTFC